MKTVKIRINELVIACKILGETHVVAAGSMFATLMTDNTDRLKLSRAHIIWMFD